MSDVYNGKPNITVESRSVFSASFAASGISPVSAVTVSGLPKDIFDLSLEIKCCDEKSTYFSFKEKKYSSLDISLFSEEPLPKLVISFDFADFEVDKKLLIETENAVNAKILVNISVNGKEFNALSEIIIAPACRWEGIANHPETLATFVMPFSKEIANITQGIEHAHLYPSEKQVNVITEKIIKSIRERNVVCTKRDSYSPEKCQNINNADVLSNKGAFLGSPVELALIFASCAERCGLDAVIAIVRNTVGIMSIYCGVRNTEVSGDNVIFESMTKIRRALETGEMILFEPAILSSAQNVDVSYANESALANMRKSSVELVLALDIKSARKAGIIPYINDNLKISRNTTEPRDVLGKIYTSLVNRPVFKLLNGEYDAFDNIPLVADAFDKVYSLEKETEITVRPLDISEKITDYVCFADNIASFSLRNEKQKNFNDNELPAVKERFDSFVARSKQKKYITSGLYENTFHERISRMTFGNISDMKNYLVVGFVRLGDAKNGGTRYFPACFVEICLKNKYDYCFSLKNKRIIPNTVLLSYLSGRENFDFKDATLSEIVEMFENFTQNARVYNKEFSNISFIKECTLVKTNLSDFILWDDIKSYGKAMLSNNCLASLISKNSGFLTQTEIYSDSYVFPYYAPERINRAMRRSSNVVLSGNSISEKTDSVINKAAISIFDGKKTLVSSQNKQFLDEISSRLEETGFSEATLKLYENTDTESLINRIKQKVSEINSCSGEVAVLSNNELDQTVETIKEFTELIHKQDESLGISLVDLLLSYNNAADIESTEKIEHLPVDESAFCDISVKKFNMLFEKADILLNSAVDVLNAAALPAATPINHHPLYPINKKVAFGDAQQDEAFELISRIISIISEYRECFLDICDEIGIDMADIRNLDALYSFNELYKLIISSRELEIQEDFAINDVYGFADRTTRIQNAKAKAENIEYNLRFFSKELFEDVDSLLSGYNPQESKNKGLIKKFLVNRNNKDILLQYVVSENRAQFSKANIDDVFLSLIEYKKIKDFIAGESDSCPDENMFMLASFAKQTADALCSIYKGLKDSKEELNLKCAKIFKFTNTVARNPEISKKITYARAKFAQVYSENECLISKLSELIGADFSVLEFDSGILNYDGLNGYLKTFEENLPSYKVWGKWLDAKNEISAYVPSFASFLEENGVMENTDRIFACSLIHPAVNFLVNKHDVLGKKTEFDVSKNVFSEQLKKARELSVVNAVNSHRKHLKQYIQNVNYDLLYSDNKLSYFGFVNKYKNELFNLFPVILIDSKDAGAFFSGQCIADTLICSDNAENLLLSSVACAKSVILVRYKRDTDMLCEMLRATGCNEQSVSYNIYPAAKSICHLYGNSYFADGFERKNNVSLLTVNGTMRRTGDQANQSEAEVCISKAVDLVSKGEKSIVIFTLSHGQYAYIKHLLCLNRENDKMLAEALDSGYITVAFANEPCFKKYDNVIISLGAAADKAGNIGWSFGFSSRNGLDVFSNIASASASNVYIISSLAPKEFVKLQASSENSELLSKLVSYLPYNIIPLKASSNTKKNILCGNYSNAFGAGEIGVDFVNRHESSAYSLDADSYDELVDNLSLFSVLSDKGIRCESVSLLDKFYE